MAFEFFKGGKKSAEAESGVEASVREDLERAVKRSKKPGAGKALRRVGTLIASLGVLGAAEVKAQGSEGLDSLIASSKETVVALDSALRANPDRSGNVIITGLGRSESFERDIGRTTVHSNDFYIYVRKEGRNDQGEPRTTFVFDLGKDGIPDQVVSVPGEVNRADRASIVVEFRSNARYLARVAELESWGRRLRDRPALRRRVLVFDAENNKWEVVHFEDGSISELENQAEPQALWAATAAEALDALEQGASREDEK